MNDPLDANGNPDTYEATAADVARAYGPDVPGRLMANWRDPSYVDPDTVVRVDALAWLVCDRCGACVWDSGRHSDYHKKLTLGVRAMGLAMIGEVIAASEEADEKGKG